MYSAVASIALPADPTEVIGASECVCHACPPEMVGPGSGRIANGGLGICGRRGPARGVGGMMGWCRDRHVRRITLPGFACERDAP